MDYALLAATAFGAAGLYLMLPRERAPLLRLGLLLGAMALAAFFLYLVRLADKLDVDLVAAAHRKIELNAVKYPVEKFRGSSRKYDE